MEDAAINGVIWLRVSAIASLLFAAGHTLGSRSSWSPTGENEVFGVDANRTFPSSRYEPKLSRFLSRLWLQPERFSGATRYRVVGVSWGCENAAQGSPG